MDDILIIGAGPGGLACGIEAEKAGLSYCIIDQGGITDAIGRFPTNMTFFSTPELLELGGIPFTTINARPTRIEVLQYYRRVVEFFALKLKLNTRITHIESREKHFILHSEKNEKYQGKYVVIATGYFDITNRLNIPGESLPQVRNYYTEFFSYSHTKVAIVGGRNSAVEVALDLYRHGAEVTLIHRGPKLGSVKYWVLPDIENRIKEGSIIAHLNTIVTEITPDKIVLKNIRNNRVQQKEVDFVLLQIGYRPDEKLLRNAGIQVDRETLVPQYHPDTLETNVENLYIAGSVACGCKIWDIFIENSRTHGTMIVQDIIKKEKISP